MNLTTAVSRLASTLRKRTIHITAAAAAAAMVLSGCTAPTREVNGLPDPLVLSTYGTGTATYADLAAVTDAVSKDTGARLRIITSDTSIGRMGAIKSGAAKMGRLGDEYIFGFEGVNEFANRQWGPQDTRVVWAPLSAHSLMIRDGEGIDTIADLRGKKIPLVSANPSVNQKIKAMLALGGLTLEDVELVRVSYSEQPEALKQGKVDAFYHQVYGPALFELESQIDVKWVDIDPNDQAGIERLHKIAPSVNIDTFDKAPGQEQGQESYGLLYTLPITAMADMSEEQVYTLVSSMANTFPSYQDVTINTPRWEPALVEDMPREVPCHPGLVRWLEEQGRWSQEAQRQQEALLERGEKLDEAWADFIVDAPQQDDLLDDWLDYKLEVGLSKEAKENALRDL